MTVLGRDTSERLVDCAAVQGFVERVCFKTGPPGLVGTELEWLVAFADDPTARSRSRCSATCSTPPALRRAAAGHLRARRPARAQLAGLPRPHRLLAGADRGRRARPPAARSRPALVLLPTAIDPFRAPAPPAGPSALRRDGGLLRRRRPRQRRDRAGDDDQHRGAAGQPRHRRTTRTRRPAAGGCCTTVGPTMVAAFANSPVHAGRRHRLEVRPAAGLAAPRPASAPPCRPGADPATAWAALRPRRPADAAAARRRRLARRARPHLPRLGRPRRGRRRTPTTCCCT